MEMVDKNGLGLANMQVVKGRNFYIHYCHRHPCN